MNKRQVKKLYKKISSHNLRHGLICSDPDSGGWKEYPRFKNSPSQIKIYY